MNMIKRVVKSKNETTYDHPETNCDQIPPDEERSTCAIVGQCVWAVKCPADMHCPVDVEDVHIKSEKCGIPDTYRCEVGCLSLNDTFCHCHAICTPFVQTKHQFV